MMTRAEFLKALGLGAAGVIIPKSALFNVNKIVIYDNYIRGLGYYDFEKVKGEIKEGDTVQLKRDKSNKYDAYAVAVYFKNLQIGYIAAFENIVLANMLDAGVKLEAYVSKKTEHKYRAIAIAVMAELIVPTEKFAEFLESNQRADEANDFYRKGKIIP